MILEPVNIVCPHCHLKSSHYMGMSGTIHECENYTDGKTDVISGMISFDPVLIKCRQCSGFYLFESAVLQDEDETYDYEDLSFEERHPQIADYKRALKIMKGLNKDEEYQLRILYWWKTNDLIRFESGIGSKFMDTVNYLFKPFRNCKKLHRNYREYKSWLKDKEENLQQLLKLLNPEVNPDDIYYMLEIYRELGNFSKARDFLNSISEGNNKSFKRTQNRLIRRRNPYVQKIR